MMTTQISRNILLTLSYDGTNFSGWQRQGSMRENVDGHSPRTVQGIIETALEKLHRQATAVYGAGRTDAGVHAAAQAANFFSPIPGIPVPNYVPALNSILPPDVRIHRAEEVPPDFNARFSASSRTYRYFLACGEEPTSWEKRCLWHIRHVPNLAVLNRMAGCLFGELDCGAFSAAGDQSRSRRRYIEKSVFFIAENRLVFEITANAFLWKMVRTLVGTLIAGEKAGKDALWFRAVLESRDRAQAGATAPAKGLFLWHVRFGQRRTPQ